MQIVEQSIALVEEIDSEAILWKIEAACRVCYKSEGKNLDHDPKKRDALIRSAVNSKPPHTSVLEHHRYCYEIHSESRSHLDELVDCFYKLREHVIGLELTRGHSSVIVSCNPVTIRDGAKRCRNRLIEILLVEARRKSAVLYEDLP